MVWLPDSEKVLKISLFDLTQLTNVTNTQTPHDGIGRAYASHHVAKMGENNLINRWRKYSGPCVMQVLRKFQSCSVHVAPLETAGIFNVEMIP